MRRSHYVCSFAVIYGTLSFLSQDHSYTEALVMTGTPDINTKGFSQYVFENADINARGFNRLNTFHAKIEYISCNESYSLCHFKEYG